MSRRAGGLRRRLGRALPPVRRRDARIRTLEGLLRQEQQHPEQAEHRAKTAGGTAHRGRASWQVKVRTTRRLYRQVAQLEGGDRLPQWRLPHKLDSYRLAAGHGVRVPRVYAVWRTLEDVDLADLPEIFVLKSDGGASAVGVFPVRRVPGGYEQVDGARSYPGESLLTELARQAGLGRARAPYFAEELLQDSTGSALPHDVKAYCFYGEVGQVLVRDMPVHGDINSARRRFVTAEGGDLSAMIVGKHDPTVPLPPNFAHLVTTAARLSLVVPLPFVRVDLYDTTAGIVMGEFTLVPGGGEQYRPEHDTHLGTLYEQAEVRLWRDLHAGRPYDFVRGDHDDDVIPPPIGS